MFSCKENIDFQGTIGRVPDKITVLVHSFDAARTVIMLKQTAGGRKATNGHGEKRLSRTTRLKNNLDCCFSILKKAANKLGSNDKLEKVN